MIKEVYNSITNASNQGKASLSGSMKGGETGSESGFFGKMLMALQNEGEGNSQIKGTNSDGKNTESGLNADSEKENITEEGLQVNEEITDSSESEDDKVLITGSEEESAESESENAEGSNSHVTLGAQVLEGEVTEVTDQPSKTGKDGEALVGSREEQKSSVRTVSAVLEAPEAEKVLHTQESLTTEGLSKAAGSEKIPITADSISRNIPEGGVSKESSKSPIPGSTPGQQTIASDEVTTGKDGSVSVLNAALNSQESDSGKILKPEMSGSAGVDSGIETRADGERKFFSLRENGVTEGVKNTNNVTAKAENTRPVIETAQIKVSGEQAVQHNSDNIKLKEQPQLQAELANAQKVNEERGKRYDLLNQTVEGKSVDGERLALATNSGGNQPGMPFNTQPGWIKFQSENQQASAMTADQQAFFNEQFMEAAEVTENTSNEQAAMNMNRLAELPINNVFLKRSVIPGLTGAFQKATSAGKEMPQNWQKHSFDLDDGSKIELSTRNVDGVIQVKIASTSIELSKMMQQYGEEIKTHLEQECELSVDLQFDEHEGEAMEGFFGDSSSSGNKERDGNSTGEGSNKILNKRSEEQLQQTVRKFGYNQMEWTI